MLFTLAGMAALVRPVQPEKARSPMAVTVSGMVMLVSAEQFSRTPLAISVMFAGSVIPGSAEQPEKAESPMAVTVSGMVMLVRAEQPLKAKFPMLAAPDSITTVSIFARYANHGALAL